MRVILFQTEDLLILSYPVMLLLAIVAALGTLARRIRESSLDHTALLIPLTVAVLVGWLGSRLAVGLIKEGARGFSLRLLLPTEHVSGSFSIFLAIALPVLMLGLWRQRSGVLACLDVLAPSALAAFAIAKVGCLLAGCCAGGECPPGWGIRYPYGSRPYALQVATGTVKPPEVLLVKEVGSSSCSTAGHGENGATRLFGHIDFLRAVRRAPPDELTRHAAQYALTYAEMLRLAESERSAPVWPVPLFYSVSAGLLWLVAEGVYARGRRAGWTVAMVLTAYAAMRLGFDPLLPEPLSAGLGVTLAHSAALVSLIGGISLAFLCMLGKTPERVLKSQI